MIGLLIDAARRLTWWVCYPLRRWQAREHDKTAEVLELAVDQLHGGLSPSAVARWREAAAQHRAEAGRLRRRVPA